MKQNTGDNMPESARRPFQDGLAALDAHPQRAVACFQRALQTAPGDAGVLYHLGLAWHALGRLEEAGDAWRRALAARPGDSATLNNLAVTMKQLGRPMEALPYFMQAVQLDPDNAEAWNNVAMVLMELGQFQDAYQFFQTALRLKPDLTGALLGLTALHLKTGDPAGGARWSRLLLEMQPDNAEAHWNLGLCLLAMGELAEGWAEYEWRQQKADYHNDVPVLEWPVWRGEPLDGRTLLLVTEQGLGDSLHFIRYAPRLKALGGRVVVACPASLRRLFETVGGVDRVVDRARLPGLDEPVDVHLPLLSLPHRFRTTLADIPAAIPYVRADAADVGRFAGLVAARAPAGDLKVGLAWAGNAGQANDRWRSLPLAAFAPLGGLPGCRFFSLQAGAAAGQLRDAPNGADLADLMPDVRDLADTAALIENLDLVITVCTSVAHLAGALGKPAWIILPPVDPCWRWMQHRQDTPWYPSARLFRRQMADLRDQGQGFFQRLRDELAQFRQARARAPADIAAAVAAATTARR